MNDRQTQDGQQDHSIQTSHEVLDPTIPSFKSRIFEKFFLAALGSIPWGRRISQCGRQPEVRGARNQTGLPANPVAR
jgi:hypothetical protein